MCSSAAVVVVEVAKEEGERLEKFLVRLNLATSEVRLRGFLW